MRRCRSFILWFCALVCAFAVMSGCMYAKVYVHLQRVRVSALQYVLGSMHLAVIVAYVGETAGCVCMCVQQTVYTH